jgi:integrase/recombinase XerD
MFETIFQRQAIVARHRQGPLAEERERYLRHFASVGATALTLQQRASQILSVAEDMLPGDRGAINAARLLEIVLAHRPRPSRGTIPVRLNAARPWLKFLGWWNPVARPVAFAQVLDEFERWMRDERGLTPCTIEQWRYRTGIFLNWLAESGRNLASLTPEGIDAYFLTHGATRWSRISARHVGIMLRVFLRHAASRGHCDPRLAGSILTPRRYALDTLPYAMAWDDVRSLIGSVAGADEPDLRDRAILLLLATYGLRRGEVTALHLEHVDLAGGTLQIGRLKRSLPQVYPLVAPVAEAIRAYLEVRPHSPHPQIFLSLKAPRTPLTSGAIYDVVSKRARPMKLELAHRGPHSLRHACASKLLAEGMSLKEIGDHLGHRSATSTAVYTKVDLAALRAVGEFDLGGLQ